MTDTYSNLGDFTAPHPQGRTSTPGPVLVLLGFVPLTISYLAHVSDTKTLRLGVWGLGVLCWMWALPTINIDPSKLTDYSNTHESLSTRQAADHAVTNLRVIYEGVRPAVAAEHGRIFVVK